MLFKIPVLPIRCYYFFFFNTRRCYEFQSPKGQNYLVDWHFYCAQFKEKELWNILPHECQYVFSFRFVNTSLNFHNLLLVSKIVKLNGMDSMLFFNYLVLGLASVPHNILLSISCWVWNWNHCCFLEIHHLGWEFSFLFFYKYLMGKKIKHTIIDALIPKYFLNIYIYIIWKIIISNMAW